MFLMILAVSLRLHWYIEATKIQDQVPQNIQFILH
jgi:hypothetical protein